MTEPEALEITITGVDTSSNPVVTFTVADQDGEAFEGDLTGMFDDHAMRFTLAQLIPGTSGDPNVWQSYINTEADASTSTAGPDGVPVMTSAIQATYEYSGTLEELAAGEWSYTYAFDINAVTDPIEVVYDADNLHRVAIQWEYALSTGEELIYNPWFDFVPSGAEAVTRDMAAVASCNECHDPLAIHGGGRIEIEYCVQCHNPGSIDPNSGNSVDMPVMVHKIHMGHSLPSVEAGGTYTIWGYRDAEHDYSHVGYPQSISNCAKCHSADDKDTADGGNWNMVPNMAACGACHDDIDWASGDNHDGGAATSNAQCAICHSSSSIQGYHVSTQVTPNNPDLPADYVDVTYELVSASVDASNVATIEFNVYQDGVALDFSSQPTDTSGAPDFMFMYAMAQDGIDAPADWNNLGQSSGQPSRYDFANIIDGDYTGASISWDGTNNTAVVPDAFPEGATLRAVAIQGYMYQVLDGENVARHARSVYLPVSGDDERRVVVDPEGCFDCHEDFEGHGGNRVYETMVCAGCHLPNLSTTGRSEDLTRPEDTNNLKDMIHGIHGASVRDYPMEFYRGGSHGGYYAWITHDQLDDYADGTVVAFPGAINNCEKCHFEGTYMPEEIPMDALVSIFETTTGGEETIESLDAAHDTVPNAEDLIYSPAVGACASCHSSYAAVAHMEQNGGAFMWTREEYTAEMPFESCSVCHGDGSIADVSEVNGL